MKSDTWLTPPEILIALGRFTLDPCTPELMPWPTADMRYLEEEDGLKQEWFGRVWLNPPFGNQAGCWMRKLKAHGCGTALVAARVETEWFFETIWHGASSILFLKRRPHFHHIDGTRAAFNSGAPIVLVSYGEQDAAILKVCGLEGKWLAL